MTVQSWDELQDRGAEKRPLAAAVGVFDGLHIGHMRLIREVLGREGLAKGVVTFRENPKKVLRPSDFHGDLFTLDQKLEAFSALGLELCVLIDFSGDFSKLAGRKFLSLLRDRSDLRFLAVGADFKCGHRLDTSAEDIRNFYEGLGVETRLLEPVLWSGRPVSSSGIRRAIMDGRLDDVRSMLGRDYELDMRGARASSEGRGFRLAAMPGQVEPPPGKYRVTVALGGGYHPAMAVFARGAWIVEPLLGGSTGPEDGKPTAIRLEKLVSRE
jgi:riboflavin kinase / FMN adenylyltransferase